MSNYSKPAFREVGSVRELTLQTFNKVGATPDQFTAVTNGVVVGSIVPVP